MAKLKLVMEDAPNILKPVVTIMNTVPSHIYDLKNNLRPEDAKEILRFGVTIQHALWRSYRNALTCKTALIDGKVAAVWGVGGTFLGQIGMPWLMTTPEVKKVSPLRFVRIYQEEVMKMLKIFPVLVNFCDAEYDSSIRLLDIIGFTIGEPEKVGLGMYRKFEIKI